MAVKLRRLELKAQTFDITPKKGGAFDVNKNTIFQAANGGEVMNMTRSIMINPKTGE